MLNIRPFIENQDEALYVDIVNQAMAEFPDFTPITREEDEIGRKAPNFNSQGQFIAEWDNKPVGFIHAEIDPLDKENKGYISGPFVLPEFRRKHIGTALAKTAIMNFQERGIKKFEGNARATSIPAQKLLEKLGFKMYRAFSRMKRSLDALPENIGKPRDINIVDISNTNASIKIGVELTNEAFKEHFNYRPNTYEEIKYYYDEQKKLGVSFNNFVAYSFSVPVGIMITTIDPREIEHYKKNVAWLSVLGVLKPYRSQGIGKALMIHAMKFLKGKGMDEAMLGVDDTNITKAMKIYESLGFEVAFKFYRYLKEL